MFYLSLGLLHDLQVPHVCSLILSILLTLDLTNNQQQPTVTADKQTRNQLTAADMLARSHEFTSGPTSHYWISGRPQVGSADQRQRTAADQQTGIQNIQLLTEGQPA